MLLFVSTAYAFQNLKCTDPGGKWMADVGKTVRNKGVFERHEQQEGNQDIQVHIISLYTLIILCAENQHI